MRLLMNLGDLGGNAWGPYWGLWDQNSVPKFEILKGWQHRGARSLLLLNQGN